MVGPPIAHDGVDVAKSGCFVQSGDKPSGRPARIGALGNDVMDSLRQIDTVSFRDLQNRSEAFDYVNSRHGHRHAAAGSECGTEATAAEVLGHGRTPQCRLETSFNLLFGNLPERSYGRFSVTLLFSGTVKSGRPGIAKVNDPFGCRTVQAFTGGAFYAFGLQ